MPKLTSRKIIVCILVLLLIFIARPVGYTIYTWYKDAPLDNINRIGYTNDASRLNETSVDSIIKIASEPNEAIEQLTRLIKTAVTAGKKISIAGAQHSMGGHTIYPNGIVIDMKGFARMQLDSINNILSVGAGARWSQIIPYLDRYGKSVAVMQSNNSFTVGGSLSVNCHGWQPNSPPIASTVESLRLINAEGEILNCSRQENSELFSLILGGYGLFGVILDVKLRVIDNKMYRLNQYIISSEEYIKRYDELVNCESNVGMVYGRINVNPDLFMEEALLSVFYIDNRSTVTSLKKPELTSIRRSVFRGSANSEYGKNLRWKAEKWSSHFISGKKFSRNQLINEGVEVFQNATPGYTDILHEYFIPKDSVVRFIKLLRTIIPQYKTDLINITLRNVEKDNDTYMAYAHEEVFGFVMLYNQSTTPEANQAMKDLTQRLINEAIALRGTYYLPYRLHATKQQMYMAYPAAKDFFVLKKKYDPKEVFQNLFYVEYK